LFLEPPRRMKQWLAAGTHNGLGPASFDTMCGDRGSRRGQARQPRDDRSHDTLVPRSSRVPKHMRMRRYLQSLLLRAIHQREPGQSRHKKSLWLRDAEPPGRSCAVAPIGWHSCRLGNGRASGLPGGPDRPRLLHESEQRRLPLDRPARGQARPAADAQAP
jgi:hypothetical protein